MSGVTVVTVVMGAFFLIGIGVGVVTVIAASALRSGTERAERKLARRDRADAEDGAGWTGTPRAGREEPPDPGEDDENDGPSRWPGGFSG